MPSERDKKKITKFQPKGDPKDGRKVSKAKVSKKDELSSAHDNEAFRKDVAKNNANNKGGR